MARFEQTEIILLDSIQEGADKIIHEMREKSPSIHVTHLLTEAEFVDRLPEIAKSRPRLLIADPMIWWTQASNDMPAPSEDAKREGFYTGGMRCRKLLGDYPLTSHIPAIIWSVATQPEIARLRPWPANTIYVRKTGVIGTDEEVSELVTATQSLLKPLEPEVAARFPGLATSNSA